MSWQLLRSEDPRDLLSRATRDELVAFAHKNGHVQINEHMTKPDIVAALRGLGCTNIRIHNRPLGQPHTAGQYGLIDEAPQSIPVPVPPKVETVNIDAMNILDARKACKSRGIKMARTDNLEKLKAKLRGQDAA